MGEGTVFSLFVSSHLDGGREYPISGLGRGRYPIPGLGGGGTPSQVGGTPSQV